MPRSIYTQPHAPRYDYKNPIAPSPSTERVVVSQAITDWATLLRLSPEQRAIVFSEEYSQRIHQLVGEQMTPAEIRAEGGHERVSVIVRTEIERILSGLQAAA